MSSSANGAPSTSGGSSPALSEASSATEPQSNQVTKALDMEVDSNDPLEHRASSEVGEADEGGPDNNKTTRWLVTSCDVGTTEPRSISQELERLQVLKSYHIMDPERDEAFDTLTRMASRILDTPYTFLSLVDMGRIWFRSNPDSDCEQQLTRDILSALARAIMRHDAVFNIPDINLDDMFRQGGDSGSNPNSGADSGSTQFRFFAGAPLVSPEGYRLGAVCMLGTEPRPQGTTEMERENLKDLAELAVKTMVDRRKLTTQGSPSHLVACTAHDLITPLTGIQLSLSLLQQDGEFQAKLGDKRAEHISAAVRSSNMMLRICQSTIETLRGNRKLPGGNDWSLPRNLMQIAEASPFIDMKEFAANLQAISNSIPKRVPLKIVLHPSAPLNIVSDGLKIFRSALNLLSNACSRANSGSIVMTIFDDGDSLVFECEDNGKEIEMRDCQSLFSQDNDVGNFGLYSVAYQINWLGGKYGVRKRSDGGDMTESSPTNSYADASAIRNVVEGAGKTRKAGASTKSFTVFWFSIPIVLPQDVSELMGLAKSLSDNGEAASTPTFKADLPVTPPASPLLEDSQRSSPSIPMGTVTKAETTRTLNALIIEDSTTVRKILGRALSKLGYQVFEAVDGMEGLRELKNTMFDMVLCDFLMPVMDGLDCVKQYREWEATNRQVFRQYIVGISAHASRNDIERGLKLGMNDFKPKPIMLKTLTGLHESSALRAVRASLDSLLDIPSSFEVQRRRLSDGNYTLPSASAAKTIDDNGSNTPIFAIPGPRDPSERSVEEDKEGEDGFPRFAVPRRPSQLEKGNPPVFSIPPEFTDAGRRSPKGKVSASPLFSIQAKESEPSSVSTKQSSSSVPLFSLPMNKSDSKPLFSIPPTQSNSSDQKQAQVSPLFSLTAGKGDSKQQSSKGGATLFSIPEGESTGQKSVIQGSPLFSILPTQSKPEQKSPPKPSLFSISVNPTEPAGEGQRKPALFSLQNSKQDGAGSKGKKPALFTLPINTTESPSEEKKPAALFSLQNSKLDGAGSTTKKPALFTLPIHTTEPPSNAKKSAPLFSLQNSKQDGAESKAKKPALFALPIHTTEPPKDAKKPAPLFSITRNAKSDGQQETRNPPPLFQLPIHTTAQPSEKQPATLFSIPRSTADSSEKQRETRKSPLFSLSPNSAKSANQTNREKKASPLFSLTKPGTEPQQESQKVGTKQPLFPIASQSPKVGDQKEISKPPLFSIASDSTQLAAKQASKNAPLFSIAPNSTNPGDQTESKKRPLFSIAASPTKPGGNKESKNSPLFPLASSTAKKESKNSPLFAIAPNPTRQGSQQESKTTPLFSIATSPAKSSDKKGSTKPPLFSLQSSSSRSEKEKECKKPPLFSIPHRIAENDEQSLTKPKKPALFSISVNPTALAPSEAPKKPSLFDPVVRTEIKNGAEAAPSSKRPALFAIPGKGSTSDADAKGNSDNGSESADGNPRPKKAMKRALFDMATRSEEK